MTTILVIDDEYIVRYTLARILRRHGYAVVTAADGERGMVAFRNAAPDVVIADLVLSEAQGAAATIRQLRRERPDAKIIAIAHSCDVDNTPALTAARRIGADDVIARPFDTADLLRQLRLTLGEEGFGAR